MSCDSKNKVVNIVATGSDGNCIIYNKSIALDIGVAFNKIRPYIYDLNIILLSHAHSDHLNISTLKKLQSLRPTLRIGCGDWMVDKLQEHKLKNIDVYSFNKWFDYGDFKLAIVKLYHDVKNCGYRIVTEECKIFHATDTSHLEGIIVKDYDIYCIEQNYDEDTVWDVIKRIESKGGFAHQRGSINTHLSKQQAQSFFLKNKNKNSQFISLHESNSSI